MATPDQPSPHHRRRPEGGGARVLEQVEATFEPYGGKWLVLGAHDEVLEGRAGGLRAEEMLAALTAFLAPYRDGSAAAHDRKEVASA